MAFNVSFSRIPENSLHPTKSLVEYHLNLDLIVSYWFFPRAYKIFLFIWFGFLHYFFTLFFIDVFLLYSFFYILNFVAHCFALWFFWFSLPALCSCSTLNMIPTYEMWVTFTYFLMLCVLSPLDVLRRNNLRNNVNK